MLQSNQRRFFVQYAVNLRTHSIGVGLAWDYCDQGRQPLPNYLSLTRSNNQFWDPRSWVLVGLRLRLPILTISFDR